jgi:formylglycine-generating enzyme required for sulfatase activity
MFFLLVAFLIAFRLLFYPSITSGMWVATEQTPISNPPSPIPDSPTPETPRSSQNEPIPSPTASSQLQSQTLNNIITVDVRGKEINRRSLQVQYFTEDKLSLPSGVKPIEMALIPAGEFKIGSLSGEKERSNDEDQVNYPIKFSQAFYMSRYEVTQKQWFAVMGSDYDANGFNKRFRELDNKFKGDNRPMVMVDWNDAKAYCKKLSELTGKSYRLPSESEWEYSCRAKSTTPFYFGETITAELVNHDSNFPYGNVRPDKSGYREETTNVGSFPPNEWGLYDMHGNVWEWCEDPWHDNYNGIPNDGSAWLIGGEQNRHIVRGGSWLSNAYGCRSAIRFRVDAGNRILDLGFRVVL